MFAAFNIKPVRKLCLESKYFVFLSLNWWKCLKNRTINHHASGWTLTCEGLRSKGIINLRVKLHESSSDNKAPATQREISILEFTHLHTMCRQILDTIRYDWYFKMLRFLWMIDLRMLWSETNKLIKTLKEIFITSWQTYTQAELAYVLLAEPQHYISLMSFSCFIH